MIRSESIGELSAALAATQKALTPVIADQVAKVKTRTGGEFSYKYVDLGQAIEMARPIWSANGLSIAQFPVSSFDHEAGTTYAGVNTLVMHTSGQWIESELMMVVAQSDTMSLAQAIGSVISYARRYSLTAILAIAQEDNDAARPAQARPAQTPPKKMTPAKAPTQTEHAEIKEGVAAKAFPEAVQEAVDDLYGPEPTPDTPEPEEPPEWSREAFRRAVHAAQNDIAKVSLDLRRITHKGENEKAAKEKCDAYAVAIYREAFRRIGCTGSTDDTLTETAAEKVISALITKRNELKDMLAEQAPDDGLPF